MGDTEVYRRMHAAVAASGRDGMTPNEVIKICEGVAIEDNKKLLDMYRARGKEIEEQAGKMLDAENAVMERSAVALVAFEALLSNPGVISFVPNNRIASEIASAAVMCAKALRSALAAEIFYEAQAAAGNKP